MTDTKRPKTALDSDTMARWMETKAAGTHHVFRFRYVCPHCEAVWCQDITDDPDDFAEKPIPDRRNLGRAMLCGTCEARSRMIVGSVVADIEPEFCLQDRDLYESLGKLYRDHNTSWVMVKGMGPYNGDPKSLLDEKREQVLKVATRKDGGRTLRRCSYTITEATERKWRSFDAPDPRRVTTGKQRLGR